MKQPRPSRILLVTGMSGAGKSTALDTLEDLGWEVVDNLPLILLNRLLATDVPQGAYDARPLAFGPCIVPIVGSLTDPEPESDAAMIVPSYNVSEPATFARTVPSTTTGPIRHCCAVKRPSIFTPRSEISAFA